MPGKKEKQTSASLSKKLKSDVEMTDTKADVKKKANESTIPERLELQRTRVICGADMNYHVSRSMLQIA
jgi:hypothetical protein